MCRSLRGAKRAPRRPLSSRVPCRRVSNLCHNAAPCVDACAAAYVLANRCERSESSPIAAHARLGAGASANHMNTHPACIPRSLSSTDVRRCPSFRRSPGQSLPTSTEVHRFRRSRPFQAGHAGSIPVTRSPTKPCSGRGFCVQQRPQRARLRPFVPSTCPPDLGRRRDDNAHSGSARSPLWFPVRRKRNASSRPLPLSGGSLHRPRLTVTSRRSATNAEIRIGTGCCKVATWTSEPVVAPAVGDAETSSRGSCFRSALVTP